MRSPNSHSESKSRRWSMTLAVAATSAILALGACNTMEGLGEDTQAAGAGLEREAEDAKR